MNKNKGVINLWLVVSIVLLVAIVGGIAFYLGKSSSKEEVKVEENNLPNNTEINQNQNLPTGNNQETKCNSNSEPWIKVVSPNGGEVFKVGDKMTIKWDSCNMKDITGFEQIKLIHFPTDSDTTIIDQTNINTKNKTLTWDIPSSVDTTKKYKIYLETGLFTQGDDEYSPSDDSDNSFTINSN